MLPSWLTLRTARRASWRRTRRPLTSYLAALGLAAVGLTCAEGFVPLPEPPLVPLGQGTPAAVAQASRTPLTPSEVSKEIWRMVFEDKALLGRRLQEALGSYVADTSRCALRWVPASGAKLLQGGFYELTLQLDDTVVDELRVRHAWVRMRDCVLDLQKLVSQRKFEFKDQGEVDMLLVVGESDLNDLFRRKAKKLKVKDPRFDFRPSGISFEGGVRALFIDNHVKLRGTLRPEDGSSIHFHPSSMNLGFLPVPGPVLRLIESRINPLAKLDSFKFKVSVDVITTTDDSLYLASGSMRDEVARLAAAERAPGSAVAAGMKPAVATEPSAPAPAPAKG